MFFFLNKYSDFGGGKKKKSDSEYYPTGESLVYTSFLQDIYHWCEFMTQ
jgi:hypothetical protein